jgi:hypothetical protein
VAADQGSLAAGGDVASAVRYNERNLTANSVIVPVAHYLHLRGAGDSYLDSTADAADRLALQRWVTRSLVKRGIWGSGLDTLLSRIRDVLRTNSTNGFPVAAVEEAMAAVGKSLAFDNADRRAAQPQVRGQRTFSVLSVLYPGLDLSKKFHEDHIFPKSRFTKRKLLDAGVPLDSIDDYLAAVNLLPNLQLLAGTANIEKQDGLPAEWIDTAFPSEDKRATYLGENDLDGLPLDLADFTAFSNSASSGSGPACSPLWDRHRERRKTRLSLSPRSRTR